MLTFTIFPRLNVTFSCFKQSPVNLTVTLVPTQSNEGLKILFGVVGVLILLSENFLKELL